MEIAARVSRCITPCDYIQWVNTPAVAVLQLHRMTQDGLQLARLQLVHRPHALPSPPID
jgi:hypothetical protein